MSITYAEHLTIRLPQMSETAQTALLWRLQWGELHRLAQRYGIVQKRSKPVLIQKIRAALQERAALEVQEALL